MAKSVEVSESPEYRLFHSWVLPSPDVAPFCGSIDRDVALKSVECALGRKALAAVLAAGRNHKEMHSWIAVDLFAQLLEKCYEYSLKDMEFAAAFNLLNLSNTYYVPEYLADKTSERYLTFLNNENYGECDEGAQSNIFIATLVRPSAMFDAVGFWELFFYEELKKCRTSALNGSEFASWSNLMASWRDISPSDQEMYETLDQTLVSSTVASVSLQMLLCGVSSTTMYELVTKWTEIHQLDVAAKEEIRASLHQLEERRDKQKWLRSSREENRRRLQQRGRSYSGSLTKAREAEEELDMIKLLKED